MVTLNVHFKLESIDGRTFVFSLRTEDVIKIGLIERTDVNYLIDSSERYINHKIYGSLHGISRSWNCTWQYLWFT